MNVCGRLHISVHLCMFCSTNAHVSAHIRCLSVLIVEVETAFGLGALLRREKTKKQTKKKIATSDRWQF